MPNSYDFTSTLKTYRKDYVFYVKKRKGVEHFLEEIDKEFEVVIFTASYESYADQIIDRIAPFIPKSRRFYRQHCIHRGRDYIKDLSRFNRALKDIILVDNNPVSYEMNKENGLPVITWKGRRNDRSLEEWVLPTLKQLSHSWDVRSRLPEYQAIYTKYHTDHAAL